MKHRYQKLCSATDAPSKPTAKKFENSVSTLITHQVFCVHTTPEEVERQQSPVSGHFGFLGKSRDYRDVIVFEWLRFQIQTKTQSQRFQIPAA